MLAYTEGGRRFNVLSFSDVNAEDRKTCSACGRYRNVRNFDPSTVEGQLSSTCRECVSRRYQARSEEVVREFPFSFSSNIGSISKGDGVKACSACGRDLPVERFNVDRSKADGLQSMCLPCKNDRRRRVRAERRA